LTLIGNNLQYANFSSLFQFVPFLSCEIPNLIHFSPKANMDHNDIAAKPAYRKRLIRQRWASLETGVLAKPNPVKPEPTERCIN